MFTLQRKWKKYKFCLMLVVSLTFFLNGCADFSETENSQYNLDVIKDVEKEKQEQELTYEQIDKFMHSKWTVTEYLGSQVAEFGIVISDQDKKNLEIQKKEAEERYLGNTLKINQLYYAKFSEEKIYESWDELFQSYRQPLVLKDVIEQPFQVIQLKVEDTQVIHSFIFGADKKEAVLFVNGHFFKIEKAYQNTFERFQINFTEDYNGEIPENLEIELKRVLLENQFDEFVSKYSVAYKMLSEKEIEQQIESDSSGILQDYEERIADKNDSWFMFDGYPFIIIRHSLGNGEYVYYEFLPEGYVEDFAYVMRALGKNEEYFFIEWEGIIYLITTKKQGNERIGIATYCMHGENLYGWVLYQEKLSENEIGTRRFSYSIVGSNNCGMKWPELEINNELSWEWVIQPGEYENFHFVNDDWIALQNESGNYIVMNTCKEIVLQDEYEAIGKFSEDLAEVIVNGKSGYINTVEEIVVECQYDEAGAFQEGFAAVKQNGKWGYINTAGEIVVECQYDEAGAFQEGFAAVKQNGKWGYINTAGEIVVECQYDEVGTFHEGAAAIKQRNKWGYIDTTGRIIIELKYDEAGNFSEGKAAVKVKGYEGNMDKWAYINKNDEIVIDYYPYSGGSDCGILQVGEFHNGMAFVTKDLYCFMDEKGNRVYEDTLFFLAYEDYSDKYDANPGYVYTDEKMTVRKYGLVSARGEQRLEPVFDYISGIAGDYVLVSMYSENGELEDGVIRLIQR